MLTANSYLNSFFLTSAFFSFYSSFWCTLSNNSSFLWWQRKISSSNAIFNLCKIIFFKKQTNKQKKASIPNCSYLWTFYFLFECLHVHFAITLCKNSYGLNEEKKTFIVGYITTFSFCCCIRKLPVIQKSQQIEFNTVIEKVMAFRTMW